MIDFGDLLRAERKKRHLSVRKLADIVSCGRITTVSGQMINIIEKGHKRPSWKLTWALVQALDLDDAKKIRLLKAAYRDRMKYLEEREKEALGHYLSEL